MNDQEKKKIEITVGRLALYIVGTVFLSALTGFIGALNILNNDHFTIIALGGRVSALEESFVPRREVELQLRNIDMRLERIERALD